MTQERDVVDPVTDQEQTFSCLAHYGASTYSYSESESTKLVKFRNQKAAEHYGKKWRDLSYDQHLNLTSQYFDEFESASAEIKAERDGKNSADYQAMTTKRAYKAGREIYRQLPKPTRSLLQATGMTSFEVRPIMDEGWKLNDRRYESYKAHLTRLLPAMVEEMTSDSAFKTDPLAIKQQMIKLAINLAKSEAELLVMEESEKD